MKGSTFEREIAKALSLWWSKGERDDVFWRSQSSGARHTIRRKAGKDTHGQVGDLTATHPSGESLISNCVIELKRGYGKATIHEILDAPKGSKGQIQKWIEKVAKQSLANHGGRWMIIHRRDRREALVYLSQDLVESIGKILDGDGIDSRVFLWAGNYGVSVVKLADILNMNPERWMP